MHRAIQAFFCSSGGYKAVSMPAPALGFAEVPLFTITIKIAITISITIGIAATTATILTLRVR